MPIPPSWRTCWRATPACAGSPVFFLTGVDEHGQKVQNAARSRQRCEPQAYVDQMAGALSRHLAARCTSSYDDFIRTTEPRHERVVQQVLQRPVGQRGEIYRGDYEGWYCVPDERFWTEKDLRGGCARTAGGRSSAWRKPTISSA